VIAAFWGSCAPARRSTIGIVIASNPGTVAIAVVMIVTGVLMLASVVREVPKRPAVDPAQGDVVLVATKSKKRAKGTV
jgi:hypothetical protein